MTKQVFFAKEARDKILAGVKKITDAVRVTMGASGKCVLIGEAVFGNDGMIQLPTIISKDGFTVTKHFSLPEPVENRGALMIKEAAAKTVEMAGDATTCTCVLAEAIISGGMELIDKGANSQELKKGIDKAVENAVEELKKISISVSGDSNKIFHVASVSANNDPIIGRLIADAFEKIGEDGVIDIVESKGMTTEIKISEGHKFNRGWVSPFFVNNKGKELCEFENPLILLYANRINHHTQIQRGLEVSMMVGRPLLIICQDADDEGLAFLAMNNLQNRVRVCVVKAPSYGDLQREGMEDIASVTGGTFISDNRGLNIKEVELENFGSAKKVIVTKEETVIIGGEKDPVHFEELINDLKMNLAQAKTEDEKYPIEKRIARLTGGVAVIHVGAATETELKEKLDRCDDAVRATKAAVAEGFVAGGGTAFIRIASKINIDSKNSADYQQGQRLVSEILSMPLKQMASNAGVNVVDVLAKVLDSTGNFGYNTKTEAIEDLVESGIIDSTKALRCALINAASISGMLLTSECLIETVF